MHVYICLDKKRFELVMDVDDEVDLVQPTPPRPTPREYRKKEKKITTSTFVDEDGFVCKEYLLIIIKCLMYYYQCVFINFCRYYKRCRNLRD